MSIRPSPDVRTFFFPPLLAHPYERRGLVRQTDAGRDKILQNIYTPYSLRHFYASMLIAENKDLKTIQERLGHVDAAMTPQRVWAPL
jgi:integrase